MNACLEPLWPASQAQAYKPVTPGQAALVAKCETREWMTLLYYTVEKKARIQAGIPGRHNDRHRKEGKKN